MDKIHARVAVLVTGGFHADGIAELLKEKGVCEISYIPKISKVEIAGGSAYLSVFAQEKTPLEKLFEGKRLFVSIDPMAPEVVKTAKVLAAVHREAVVTNQPNDTPAVAA